MNILDGLNEVQKQALLALNGAVLVTAGAGSGKTKLLTHRIAYLVEHEKVLDGNILAITFTNKAAKEMKDRVSKLLNRSNDIWISTFHSMCLKILRQYITLLKENYTPNFSIYSESDSEKTLKQILKDLSIPNEEYKTYAHIISDCKNQNMDIYTYVNKNSTYKTADDMVIKVYETYEKTLEKNNAIDFDGLLTKTYQLLLTNKNVLYYFSNRFEYVFVDEFQDTNVIQYDIIKLLTRVHKNVFVVGDEDQCIYTWRGAKFQNIFNFKNDFAPVKMFKLEQNYRSTKNIIDKANKLISNNTERFDKVLWTANTEGKDIEYYQFYDEQTEAESIASKIIALKNNGNYKNSDIAILMRMNALTLPFEQKLLNYNIPYRIYGGFKFYERQEIKNIISYLTLFTNPNDDTALMRIINFPKRAIGDAAVKRIRDYALSKNMSMLNSMIYLCQNSNEDRTIYLKIKDFVAIYLDILKQFKTIEIDKFCELVVDRFGIKNAYMDSSDENTNKLMNIDMLINSMSEFISSNPGSTMEEYLESITLESDLDYMGEDDTITLSTVHSVKGLEFKVVFVIGLEDGIFPLSRAFSKDSDMEEERRLMYVAMTRAKERLFLTYANTRYLHGKRTYEVESRFLEEIGANINKKKNTSYNDKSFDYSTKYYGDNTYKRYNDYNDNYPEYDDYETTSFIRPIKPSITSVKSQNGYVKADTFLNEDKPLKKDVSIYKKGQKVSHPKFGQGEILEIVDDGVCAEINFESFGKKTLILEIAPLTIL